MALEQIPKQSFKLFFVEHTQYKTTEGTDFLDRNKLPHFCLLFIFWLFSP
jgi:hypothetical protein